LELRTPVKGKLWFTLFGDAGNNWLRFRDIRLDDMLVSMGVGLQYLAPVGPIRLDYARRVVHPGHPKSDRVHLSILFSF
jgi:outer membrane protein insertion porin family